MNPKKAPTKVNGTEINSHKLNNATKVPKGTAAEEPLLHSIRLVIKKTVKMRLEIEKNGKVLTQEPGSW